jgi:multiple sugar transport system ATP-binding protein
MGEVLLEDLTKKFDEVTAVREVNLTIHDGEFVVLLGPSGCGKTTTLRMIAGLEEITSGRIYLDGRVLNDVHPSDRDIAMVFQNYALYPHMSVYKNMEFGLKMRKVAKDEIDRRVKSAAGILGIESLLGRYPGKLSGGQRQRVALGRAIVRDPRVFLFDEPLSNLDAMLRVQTRVELLKLHQHLAATSIYVTHDQIEAMTMGDRIVVMDNGTIQQVGPPMEVYQNPANKFVAGFIGSPSMNFLSATVRVEGGRAVLEGSGFRVPLPPERAGELKGREGEEVVFGIRPENMHLGGEDGIEATVEIIEPVGSDIFLNLSVGGASLTARVESTVRVSKGERVRLCPDSERVHAFDPGTGATLI